MKILHINKFFFLKGGSERYMFNSGYLFRNNGHEVAFFSMHHPLNDQTYWKKYFISNVDYNVKTNIVKKIRLAFSLLYSFEAKRNLGRLIDEFKPDIAHLHIFSHQLTPSIIFALKKRKIPIVITLHDYKLICPSYNMLNNKGQICNLCKNGNYINSFKTKCHKNSYLKSLNVALESYLHHRLLKSYSYVDEFISPSMFLLNKHKEMGFNNKINYLSNFIDPISNENKLDNKINQIVFFGRLSEEKGINTLIDAVKDINVDLNIIGTGPLYNEIKLKINNENIDNIKLLGYLKGDELWDQIKKCSVVVVPSEWYENNPFTILESFALGKPVIGSDIGGIPELVINDKTGFTFKPGDSQDLQSKLIKLMNDVEGGNKMGINALNYIRKEINSDIHYTKLTNIYKKAIKRKNRLSIRESQF